MEVPRTNEDAFIDAVFIIGIVTITVLFVAFLAILYSGEQDMLTYDASVSATHVAATEQATS